MAIGAKAIFDAVVTHLQTIGWFDNVNRHETKRPPGHGLSADVYVQSIGPYPAGSGLASTTARVVLNIRVYADMVTEPQDDTDRRILDAVDALMADYTGNFQLGLANVRNVDVLGNGGPPMSAQAGYLNINSRMYRIMAITLPIVINDAWPQAL